MSPDPGCASAGLDGTRCRVAGPGGWSRSGLGVLRSGAAALLVLLGACASGPPPPAWQLGAKGAVERAVAAYLEGNARVERVEADRARREIGRSGRVDQLARAELTLCAARVASLEFEPCAAFEALRADAPAAERAYAEYLLGRATPQDIALLPSAQRAAAGAREDDVGALRVIDDPLSRLVAIGVRFGSGRAPPAAIALAAETASAQGWRRPLLAWLRVQLAMAEQARATEIAEQLKRRIAIVEGR